MRSSDYSANYKKDPTRKYVMIDTGGTKKKYQ